MKLKEYIAGKTIKQRIYLIILLVLMAFLIYSIIKTNLNNAALEQALSQQQSESITDGAESDTDGTIEETAPQISTAPKFHISFIDVGILLIVIIAYCIHKYREKKRERRK